MEITVKDRRSWRLVIEKAVKEKLREERKRLIKMTITMAILTPDDSDSKRRTTPVYIVFIYIYIFHLCSRHTQNVDCDEVEPRRT